MPGPVSFIRQNDKRVSAVEFGRLSRFKFNCVHGQLCSAAQMEHARIDSADRVFVVTLMDEVLAVKGPQELHGLFVFEHSLLLQERLSRHFLVFFFA